MQFATITEQYRISLKAILEESKFLQFIAMSDWPSDMKSARQNMAYSTVLDEEINENTANEHTILPSLRNGLRRADFRLLKLSDERLRSKIEEQSDSQSPANPTPSPEPNDPVPPENSEPVNGDGHSTLSGTNPTEKSGDDATEKEAINTDDAVAPIKEELSDEQIKKQLVEDHLSKLRTQGVDCFQMDWQTYLSSVWTAESGKVDIVVTEPPQAQSRNFVRNSRQERVPLEEISTDEVEAFPNFCRLVLHPGGFAVVFIHNYIHREWYEAFFKAGFKVMPSLYTITKDSNTIPPRETDIFPQDGTDYVLIAQNSGDHSQGFKPDLKSTFSFVDCSNTRRLATMFNAKAPRRKLRKGNTRVPYMTKELSAMVLSEFIDMYCPQNGIVMDPYAGTMTTAMAALRTGRQSIVIERQRNLFSDAVLRLRSLLPGSTFSLPSDVINLDVQMVDTTTDDQQLRQEDECDSSQEGQDDLDIEEHDELDRIQPHCENDCTTSSAAKTTCEKEYQVSGTTCIPSSAPSIDRVENKIIQSTAIVCEAEDLRCEDNDTVKRLLTGNSEVENPTKSNSKWEERNRDDASPPAVMSVGRKHVRAPPPGRQRIRNDQALPELQTGRSSLRVLGKRRASAIPILDEHAMPRRNSRISNALRQVSQVFSTSK